MVSFIGKCDWIRVVQLTQSGSVTELWFAVAARWTDVTSSLKMGGCVCTRDANDVTNVASPLLYVAWVAR